MLAAFALAGSTAMRSLEPICDAAVNLKVESLCLAIPIVVNLRRQSGKSTSLLQCYSSPEHANVICLGLQVAAYLLRTQRVRRDHGGLITLPLAL